MSKLQKALQELRDQSQREQSSRESRSTTVVKRELESRSNVYRSAVNARTNGADAQAVDSKDFEPVHHIKVSEDRLQREGLRPSGDNTDSVDQQFRHIKRPVLKCAFGSAQDAEQNFNAIMVASALPKSGKSFCSLNLATSIARERDIGVLLVDADVLKPNISRAFGVEDKLGLIDYLLDPEVGIEDILLGTDFHDILVMPAGSRHAEATELLASRRMGELIHSLSLLFPNRVIVFDTPPLLLTNEAHVLAEHVGQIVLVIEAGKTTIDSVNQALAALNRDKPINAILNKSKGHSFGEYGGAGYGYYGSAYGEDG